MPDLKESGYDQIQLANGTRAEVEAAKGKLNTFEPVIITDEDKFAYKDAQGNLKDVAFGDSNELRGLIDQNKSDIDQNKSDILSKLDKGNFTGTADDLSKKEDDWKISTKSIGNQETVTDIIQLWELGHYRSESASNKWVNLPKNCSPAFELEVTSIGQSSKYRTLKIKSYISNAMWVNTQTNYQEPYNWTGWTEIFTTDNCPISKQQNGYCKLANGLIIQWGVLGASSSTTYESTLINLPITFSTGGGYVVTLTAQGTSEMTITTIYQQEPRSDAQFEIFRKNTTGGSSAWLKWIAIGY